jgi:meso-butanediol dehydrogenase / (S,S)-butanediol dehydrogenase / diacetyl reductase
MNERVVVVTGAASGIGRATVLEFAARGATVVPVDRDGPGLEQLARELGEDRCCELDVTNTSATQQTIDTIVEQSGCIDVLANVAGMGSTENVVNTPPPVWDAVFDVNVRGVFNTCRAALPHMLGRGSGSVVNVASVAGMVGLRNRAAYCASKAAVIGLTKAMAIDHVADGVRVNCVCPGTIDTPWVGRLLEQASDPTGVRADLEARQPMGRLGKPEEIAKAVVYLAGSDAAFITGTELVIDGGLTAA